MPYQPDHILKKMKRKFFWDKIEDHCHRHLVMVKEQGSLISSAEWQQGRRIAYDHDHERGLFKISTPVWENGDYVYQYMWSRCIYTRSMRAEYVQEHLTNNCDGWDHDVTPGTGAVAKAMNRCGCPIRVTHRIPCVLKDPNYVNLVGIS